MLQEGSRVWHEETSKRRLTAGNGTDIYLDVKPWSARSGIYFKGCSKQGNVYNFLHESTDVRVLRWCLRNKLPFFDFPIALAMNLWTDERQSCKRQLATGSMTMLSGSLPYWHFGDRTALGEECLYHHGWPTSIDVSKVHLADKGASTAGLRQPTLAADGRKRRASRPTGLLLAAAWQAKTRELAGNCMSLPDLFNFMQCSVLGAELGAFAVDPQWLPDLSDTSGPRLFVDANASKSELRAFAQAFDGQEDLDDDAEEDLSFWEMIPGPE